VPWPLRGTHRWGENELLRVNDTVLGVDKSLAALDFIWDEARITDRLVTGLPDPRALDKDPITLTGRGRPNASTPSGAAALYTAEDTWRWIEAQRP